MMGNGECLFDDNRNDNEYDDDDGYDDAEDGKESCGGADDGGNPTRTVVTLSAGCPLAVWVIGHRSSAPALPPPSSTTTMTIIPAAVGGRCAPPPPVCPLPPDAACCCQCCHQRPTAVAQGHLECDQTRGGGGGGQRHCTHSSGSNPSRGGLWGEEEWHDVGGITWQSMSGWGRRRRKRCAARATALRMMATGEGGERGREEGEEVC